MVIAPVASFVTTSLLMRLGAGGTASIPGLVAHASPFSKAVLLLLLAMSVYSWGVLWDRLRLFGRVRVQDGRFLRMFRATANTADIKMAASQHPISVLAHVALAGQKASEQYTAESVGTAARFELVQRAMDRAADEAVNRLERHVGFLATTGSVAPFIGLMGTVWGVMVSFVNIGAQGSATLVVVAPGIAEALIATAIGLVAAIPAVMAYNYFLRRINVLSSEMENFSSDYLNIVRRHFLAS
jgi:biopolymer transport protein TolQ